MRHRDVNPTMARELRNELIDSAPGTDLTIIDALMAVTTGCSAEALRLARDHDSPDARTVIFGVLITTRGKQAALGWENHENSGGDRQFLSGPGWVNWAICSAKLGRWDRAAERLQELEALWSECPMLAFIEGMINAATLLPEEFRRTALDGVPLFPGIRTAHGLLASHAHARATYCFQYVQRAIAGVEIDIVRSVRDWMLWLRVVDPTNANSELARAEITDRMNDGLNATTLVLFATVFEIPYNAQPLREYLDRRKRIGGLDDDEILAEILLLQGSIGSRDLVAYIETHREHLTKVVHPAFLVDMEVEALARDGQPHRARALIAARITDLGEEHVARLDVFLSAVEGSDPRTALEQLYRKKKSIVDLRNLVSHLKSVKDTVALRPLLVEMFSHERTADNALDVIRSLSDPSDYDSAEIISFVEGNLDLVSQHDDLKAAHSLALFRAGRLEESRRINEDLVGRRADLYDSLLDINIAIVSGDWDRIPVIVDREWSRRDSHDGPTLIYFASLASGGASGPDRALGLARLATEKAPSDAKVLSAAFWLYCRLGRERDADPEWLKRAADLSSPDEGPLWRVDLEDAVERWFPRRRDVVKEVERKWLGGEIPLSVAAATFNVSLARMVGHIPSVNLVSLDGRKRVSLPIISGDRSPVEMRKDWTIGLDVTSVMVLEYIGFLQHTIDAFDKVYLSPDVMELLFHERHEARFHQPSLVSSAREIVALQHAGKIVLAEDITDPPKELIEEVGVEIASLLHLAEQENGMVVCVLPLHKAGSLTESANVGSLGSLVLSTVDVCTFVYATGRMDAADYQRAMRILTGTGQGVHCETKRSINEGPIYITDVALSYLQDANLLRAVAEGFPNVLVHPVVVERAQGLIEQSDHSNDIQAWIDGIRIRIADAMSDGTIALLPRPPNQNEISQPGGLGWRSATSLLMNTDSCDALCVDDRCLNRHSYVDSTSEKPVPIVCAIDILRHLVSLGAISDARHWAARHKMRRSGFSFIPFEPDELLHWLSPSRVVAGNVVETAELTVLRQSVANATLSRYLTAAEATTLSANHTNIAKSTIGRIWQDTSVPVDRATALSDWLWQNLVVAGIHNRCQSTDVAPEESVRRAFVARLAAILLPIPTPSEERLSHFSGWLQQSVLSPLQPANDATVEQAIDLVCDTVASFSEGQELYGNQFLVQLPSSVRTETISRHPKLTERWGFTLVPRFHIKSNIDVVGRDLAGAVRRVFATGSDETIESASKNRSARWRDSSAEQSRQ